MLLDSRGIPILDEHAIAAPECPPKPCDLCTGIAAMETMTSWEWCQRYNTCAATIDWEKVYGHD